MFCRSICTLMNSLLRFCIHTDAQRFSCMQFYLECNISCYMRKMLTSPSHNMKYELLWTVCTTCMSQKHFSPNTNRVFSLLAHSWKTLFKQGTQRINANSLLNCSAMRRVEPCYLTAQQWFSGLVAFNRKKRVFTADMTSFENKWDLHCLKIYIRTREVVSKSI